MVASPGGVIVVVLIAIVLIVLVFVVVVLIVIVSIAVVVVVMVVVAVGLERYIDAARLIRGKATESLVVGKDAVHLKFGESKNFGVVNLSNGLKSKAKGQADEGHAAVIVHRLSSGLVARRS